jgi:hypothetical protein
VPSLTWSYMGQASGGSPGLSLLAEATPPFFDKFPCVSALFFMDANMEIGICNGTM